MSFPSVPDFLDLELGVTGVLAGALSPTWLTQQRLIDFRDAIEDGVDLNEIAYQISLGAVTGLDVPFRDRVAGALITPVQWAHRNGHFELATLIERALKKIRDAQDRSHDDIIQVDRETFLRAIEHGDFPQVMDFLRRGIRDDREHRVLIEGLDLAANIFLQARPCEVRDIQLDIIRLLIVNKVRPSFRAIYALIFANPLSADRYLYMITEFHRNIFDIAHGGYDINQQFGGNTLLIMAIINGNETLVDDLLNYGANPEARDNLNYTPLMHTAKLGNRRVLCKLLARGVDIEAEGSDESNAETLARDCGHYDVVGIIRQVRLDSFFK